MSGGSSAVPTGSAGIVRKPLDPTGTISAGGEEWSARSADNRSIERGTAVRIVQREGLTLVVEPEASSSSQSSS
jgi:membrane-bound ClpP family serine protease